MMEKAIKQRLLGGLVLVAGAALFLPVLLDGSGAALTIPPMPAAPEVATIEDMAPRLEQKVVAAEQEVEAAHAGREALPAASAVAGDATDAGADSEVLPDAAALAATGGSAAAAVPAKPPAAPVSVKPMATAPTSAAKPVAPVAAPARVPAPEKPAVISKATVPAAEKPVALVKPSGPDTPAVTAGVKPSPSAWVVQVASLSTREKAQTLMQQLRRKGYPAVLSQHAGNWKVMVGPELSREVAGTMKNRLNADAELDVNDAWVQAYQP